MKNLELAYLAVAYGMAGIMFYGTRHATFPTVSHVALDRKLARRGSSNSEDSSKARRRARGKISRYFAFLIQKIKLTEIGSA